MAALCSAGLVMSGAGVSQAAPIPVGAATAAVPAKKKPPRDVRPSRDTRPSAPAPWLTETARDMTGYRRSAYTGRFFDPAYEQFRLCVVQREAGGQYDVVSWGGPWRGAYQFSTGWKYEIVKRIDAEMANKYGEEQWNRAKRRLLDTNIDQWNRFFQDAGFWAIFDGGNGARNWAGGNWYCDPGRWDESGWPNAGYWNYTSFEGPRGF